jgi:hypothetical protein
VIVGVAVGSVGALVYGFATQPKGGAGSDVTGSLNWLEVVLWAPAMLLICLATGGMVGALGAVFFCALRKPRRP